MIDIDVTKTFSKNQNFYYKLRSNSNRIVLFGPSGSGKSNLLKMIAGFLDPDDGVIKINDKYFFKNRKKIPPHKRRVGYLPQEYTLFPHMTVLENILYGIKVNNLNVDKSKITSLMKKLNLQDKLNFYPHQLSGGEKQRVAFARAILINPEIFLLDEPFSALDESIKEKIRDEIIDLLNENYEKAIFVTHNIQDAFIFGDEIFIIYKGKIIENGTPEKIFNNPKFVETAKLINFKNILKTKNFNEIGKILNINTDFFGIKPENILLNDRGDIKLPSRIERIRDSGVFYEIKLKFNDISLISVQYKNSLSNIPKKGEKLTISIKKESIIPLIKFEDGNI